MNAEKIKDADVNFIYYHLILNMFIFIESFHAQIFIIEG